MKLKMSEGSGILEVSKKREDKMFEVTMGLDFGFSTAIGYKSEWLVFEKHVTIGEMVQECGTRWDLRVSEMERLEKEITDCGVKNAVTFDLAPLRK
jgi:hypothetical protein